MKTCILILASLLVAAIVVLAFADEIIWENISTENLDLRTILLNPESKMIIYFGSHQETGSTTKSWNDILMKGRNTLDWDIRLTWDLGEIIWNDDQTSIDVRSRLMVQLRDDILDEVTKLYFERIRVKMDIDSLSIENSKKRADRMLRLQELTVSLDALTGGYFSQQLNKINPLKFLAINTSL